MLEYTGVCKLSGRIQHGTDGRFNAAKVDEEIIRGDIRRLTLRQALMLHEYEALVECIVLHQILIRSDRTRRGHTRFRDSLRLKTGTGDTSLLPVELVRGAILLLPHLSVQENNTQGICLVLRQLQHTLPIAT